MKVDGVDEIQFVAEASSGVLHPLDLGVEGFALGVGDAEFQVSEDVM